MERALSPKCCEWAIKINSLATFNIKVFFSVFASLCVLCDLSGEKTFTQTPKFKKKP